MGNSSCSSLKEPDFITAGCQHAWERASNRPDLDVKFIPAMCRLDWRVGESTALVTDAFSRVLVDTVRWGCAGV
jgi:hypothetical protein